MKTINCLLVLFISLSLQQPAMAGDGHSHGKNETPNAEAQDNHRHDDDHADEEDHDDSGLEHAQDHGHEHGHDDEHDEEGITLSPDQAKHFGIALEQPQSRHIGSQIPVIGTLIAQEDARHLVSTTFPAVVQKVLVKVGDSVKQGQPLADVLVRDSQQRITLRALANGVVTQRQVSAGEFVDGTPLLEITETGELWFEFNIFPGDFSRIRHDSTVYLSDSRAVVRWVSPVVNAHGQLTARALLKNSGDWRIGQILRGNWVWQEANAAIAVKRTALQTLENDSVLFVVHDDSFEAQPVITGRQDTEWVEILSGIDADTTYASSQSYLLKADLLKAGAGHSH